MRAFCFRDDKEADLTLVLPTLVIVASSREPPTQLINDDGATHICLRISINRSSEDAPNIGMMKAITRLGLRSQKGSSIFCIRFVVWNPKSNDTMTCIIKG